MTRRKKKPPEGHTRLSGFLGLPETCPICDLICLKVKWVKEYGMKSACCLCGSQYRLDMEGRCDECKKKDEEDWLARRPDIDRDAYRLYRKSP